MKKILIWLGKAALMIGLLAAAVFACFCVVIQTLGLGFGAEIGIFEILLFIVLFPAIFALYIFLCRKIIRFDPQVFFEDYDDYFKNSKS